MTKQYSAPASFNPANGQIDGSNIANFQPTRVLAIVDTTARAFLYDAVTPGLGFQSVSGTLMTVELDTSAYSADDNILIVWDDDGALAEPQNGVVTATTVAAAMPSAAIPNGATVKASPTNAGTIRVGGSALTTSNGFPLAAGDSLSFSFTQLSKIYLIGNGTDTLAWFAD